MFPVLRTIRILVITQIFATTHCQDGFGDQNLHLRYTSNDEKINSLSFNTNSFQRDPNIQSMSSPNVQYSQSDDTNNNNNNDFGERLQSTRNRKVYRIKNPFQNQLEDTARQQENTASHDSGTGASNQYASVQYSLPPEEFLQQFRTENQYYQQTQISTPAPNLGYTATPSPQQQYQYSTIQYSTALPSYDNSHNRQNNNQIPLESKSSHGSTYLSSPSSYQYSTPNTFLDNIQSTPSPMSSYLSTPLNNGQYSSQPSSYVSSDSSVYVSSPSNQQTFVSSPLSITQTGSPDYNNRGTTSVDHNSVNFDNNEYSASRYPIQVQQQYQNDYSTTTTTTPSPYSDHLRDLWQNNINSGYNAASKPSQDSVYNNQYQNYPYQINQQDSKLDAYVDNVNSDTHRIGSVAAANNMFLNYVQPNSQALNNLKHRARDLEHDTSQTDLYSNGDFGWKLAGKKPLTDGYSSINYNRYSPSNIGASEGTAVSQMNFHIGSIKPYNYNQISKSAPDTIEQEFAQAAAKAHERLKQEQYLQQQQHQQQQQQQYLNFNTYGTSNIGSADVNNPGISYYSNIDKQKNKYTDSNSNYYSYGNSQNDLITVSPFYLSTPRDNLDNKSKQPFDHEKALKNIVSIDVSNVVGNSDPKAVTSLENNNNKYVSAIYGKDQSEQNVRQYIRPVTDSFYKDKNAVYGFNIKTKGDDYTTPDTYKQQELQTQESNYNHGYLGPSQSFSYFSKPSNNYHDSLQSSSVQQPGTFRSQSQLPTDIASILKFGDIPYKLTQGLSTDPIKFHNFNFDQGGVPSPLPSRLNQNVGNHQLDVTTNLLNKLLLNKQPTMNINNPEMDSQPSSVMSTINGFKVANPFNVDLKLVAELLKGKPIVDNSHMISLRDQYTNPSPLKLDLNSQLQYLLKNENNGNLLPLSDGLSALGNSYMDIYSNNRYPYQKFSRSQEEEESIVPIAEASNTHPIGAVIEQDDTTGEREVSSVADLTAQDDDVLQGNFEENRSKTHFLSESRIVGDRTRHPNIIISGRHSYQRKFPKSDLNEPYPLLKPPPRHHSPRMANSNMKMESKHNRRRRVYKPKLLRVIKTEPLFEAGAEPENLDKSVSIVMRPPSRVAEAKSDIVDMELTA